MDYFGGGEEGHKKLKRMIANGGFSGFVNFKINKEQSNNLVDFLTDKLEFERSEIIGFMENSLLAFF